MMEFKDKDGNVTHTLTDEGLVSRIGTQAPGVKLNVTCKHDWHFLPGTDRLRCIHCNVETGPSTPEQLAQDLLRDVATMGSAWSQNGKRIDPSEVYAASSDPCEMYAVPVELTQGYKLQEPLPNTIQFRVDYGQTEVFRISKDGIWANPDVPADEAAKKVIEAMDGYIKQMVERVRSEYTTVAWGVFEGGNLHDMFFLEIEAKEMAQLKGEHADVKPLRVWGLP